ncbi:hypothetical protein ACSBR2_007771 [Camellia fascicularis]
MLQIFYIGMAGNKFTGGVPILEKLHRIQRFSVGSNQLGSGHRSDLSFLPSLTNATSLMLLDLSDNNFGGMLTETTGNLSTNLRKICLKYNQISGSIPSGIGNLINLERIWLFGNQCTGNVPFDTGKLQNLRDLDFSENELSGNIPLPLGNLSSLIGFYISQNNLHGIIPPSLGNCKNLLSLSFSQNNLTGPIPQLVIGLSSLSDLDLSQNALAGSLPVEVGNLKNLGYLNVSNMLSGEIPGTLGSCVMLETLCMDGNLFQGTIPSTLASLRGIQFLDLSRNNLLGRIPEYFASFNLLQNLNLSFNDFEGVVPTKGIFANASAISVTGNKKLCGGIPELQLSPCKSNWFRKRRLTLTLELAVAICSGLLGLTFLLCSFGSVYKGLLENDGSIVAVKVVNLQRHGASKSFIAECEALRNIKHRNLVKVLTTCSGVDYQGDFGLARFLQEATHNFYAKQGSSIGVRGTIGYTAPEYGMGSEVTTKGDVYSYGILLLEMFTGKRPTDDMFEYSLNLHNFVKMALSNRVTEVADPMLLRGEEEKASDINEITRDCLISILQIGVTCSSGLPKERMNISDVVAELHSIRSIFLGTVPSEKKLC